MSRRSFSGGGPVGRGDVRTATIRAHSRHAYSFARAHLFFLLGNTFRGSIIIAANRANLRSFAAIVALSPLSPITAWAKALRKLPLWLIHGENDKAAPVADSDELIRTIEQAGGKPRFSRLADRDHFILDTFDRNDVFDWLREHAR